MPSEGCEKRSLAAQLPGILNSPESHVVFGRGINEVCVATPGGPKLIREALLDWIFALDRPTPDPSRVGLGTLGSVPCP